MSRRSKLQAQITAWERVALGLVGTFFLLVGLAIVAVTDRKNLVNYRGTFYNGQPLGGFYLLALAPILIVIGLLLLRRFLKK